MAKFVHLDIEHCYTVRVCCIPRYIIPNYYMVSVGGLKPGIYDGVSDLIVAKKEEIPISRDFASKKYKSKLSVYEVKIISDSSITVEADSDDEWEEEYPGMTGRYIVKKFEIIVEKPE